MLLAGGFNPAFKDVREGYGVINDADVKSAWQPCFEHLEGALFLLHITGSFQEFLKGSNVSINVAILHVEFLEFFIHFDSFGDVCEGVFKSFDKVIPKIFILLGISTGQFLIHGLLLGISLVFDFLSTDIAKA